MIPLILIVVFAVIFYIYSTWTFDYWKKKGVPFVKPKPFFGNILDAMTFKKALPDVIMDIYTAGTGFPLIGYYQFRSPALLFRDPDMVKRVLITNFDCFNEFYSVDFKLDPLLARNPIVLTGNVWKAVRSLLTPAFTSAKTKSLFPLMAVECREMIQYLERKAPEHRPGGLNVSDLTRKYTTDVVVRCGFGVFGNSFNETDGVLRKLGEDFMKTGFFNCFKFLLYTFMPDIRNFIKFRFLDLNGQNFFRQLIRELISYRENNKVFRNDYLQMLMHIKYMGYDVQGKNTIRVAGIDMEYTDEDIASHALTLFFTGFGIPSYVLTFALYRLALNPWAQEKLRAEIDEVLMSHSGGLTHEAVEDMVFLDMVISETLRMHPPFPYISRICSKSCQLPLPDGGSFILEKGTSVHVPVEALHMDPEYFPDPDVFNPERFSAGRKSSIKRYTYLPYSAGPRQCIGSKFAQAEMKAGLVTIVSHFEIRTTEKTPLKLCKIPSDCRLEVKGGVWLDFVRRVL